MMKTKNYYITGSFRFAAQWAVVLLIGAQLHAADLFSTPAKDNAVEGATFTSVTALLDATRSGDIPRMLTSKDLSAQGRFKSGVGASVLSILQTQNVIQKGSIRHDTASMIGFLFENVSIHELSGQSDEFATESFRRNWKAFCDYHRVNENPRLRDALDSILKQYSQAVKESMILTKERDDRRVAEAMETQRKSDVAVQKMSETVAQRKAVSDSQAASARAVDQARADAVTQAMQAQANDKKKKLDEVLASNAYKLWEASLRVEQGIELIETGEKELTNEARIEKESGVSDLTARRAAGERVAAGKLLVERSFGAYRELGGKAATPKDVKAGSDPAGEYR